MREDINNYGINNPDGFEAQSFEVLGQKYENDNAQYVKEDSLKGQKEIVRVDENYRDNKNIDENEEKGAASIDLSSSTSSTSSASSASSSSSAMASASASIGGSVGALAGVVAASVAAAVVVVAVFLSNLVISLSLIMADMHQIVLEVEMTGAQEEDFINPIYAILTGEDDVYQEQVVDPERSTIIFDNLQPGTRYKVVVKNDDKVFYESYYFTSTTPAEKGEIVSRMDGNDVYVTVQNAQLKATEYYTLVAKDEQGNIVYQIEGVEAFNEYHFTMNEPKNLYFYLMVNGKTYAIDSIELPEYDFDNGIWTWENDNLTATVTFEDKKDGEDLILDAEVTKKITEATCDKDGSIVYTAKAIYEGKIFTQKQTIVLESQGHNYEGTYGDDGHITYKCSVCGDTYTDEEQQP